MRSKYDQLKVWTAEDGTQYFALSRPEDGALVAAFQVVRAGQHSEILEIGVVRYSDQASAAQASLEAMRLYFDMPKSFML